jgi:hypothetical protein
MGPSELIFGVLDTSDRIYDSVAAGFSRNLAEFWLIEVERQGHKVLVHSEIDTLLNAAADLNCKYLIVGALGGIYSSEDDFFAEMKKWIEQNPDFYIVGHIADKKQYWYELHEQCFVINLDIFRRLGRPVYGTYQKGEFQLTHVERSIENFHHDFTPHWLKPTSEKITVSQVGRGFNLLDVGLKAGHPIYAFPERLRNAKFFLHPGIDGEFSRKIVWWDRQVEIFRNSFDAFDTEDMKFSAEDRPRAPLGRLITLCSGLLFFEILRDLDFVQGAAIHFYDHSPVAIDLMRLLVSDWDGRDYPKFLRNNKAGITRLLNFSDPEEKWSSFVRRFGGEEPWINFFERVKGECVFYFYETDVYGERFGESDFLKDMPGNGETLFELSNVFHYRYSSAMRSLVERVRAQDNLIESIKERCPDTYIHMTSALAHRVANQKVFRARDYRKQLSEVPHFWMKKSYIPAFAN